MSVDELVSWQAYLRRNPRGIRWDNWVQARLAQEINALQPRKRNDRMPKLEVFAFKPPSPLVVEREKAKAKARRERGEKGKS